MKRIGNAITEKELEKAINDLQGMIAGYLENSNHSRFLFTVLFNLERDMLNDHFQLTKGIKTEKEDSCELKLAFAQKAGKKETLH